MAKIIPFFTKKKKMETPEDKQAVENLRKKIQQILKNEKMVKKAAQILQMYLSKKPK